MFQFNCIQIFYRQQLKRTDLGSEHCKRISSFRTYKGIGKKQNRAKTKTLSCMENLLGIFILLFQRFPNADMNRPNECVIVGGFFIAMKFSMTRPKLTTKYFN